MVIFAQYILIILYLQTDEHCLEFVKHIKLRVKREFFSAFSYQVKYPCIYQTGRYTPIVAFQ